METEHLKELTELLHDFNLTEQDCDKPISDPHLDKISRTCSKGWRSLPSHLELARIIVDDIDHDKTCTREEEKRKTFFSTWKQKKGSHATYRKLICAFLKIECREDAEKVCRLLQKSAVTQLPNSSQPMKRKSSQPAPGATVSKKVRLNLKQQLEFNRNKIMEQHSSYAKCIRTSLKSKGVTAKELCADLLSLSAFNPHAEKKCELLFDVRNTLKKATTVEEIFIALSDVCSFHDCGIFQSIIKQYNIDQSQEEMRYPEYLLAYMESHKITEFIQINPLLEKFTNSSDPLVLKFDIESICTLADLDKLKISVANILGLQAAALRLLDIEEGCVTATYLISPSIADAIFTSDKEFTPKEKEEFQATSVQWLKYGEHVFTFGGGASHTNIEDEKSKAITGSPQCSHLQNSPEVTGPVVLLQDSNTADQELSNLSGKVDHLGVGGPRDVLLIVPEHDSSHDSSHPDAVERRSAIELTEELRKNLEDQGIARKDQRDDLSLMRARCRLDKRLTIRGEERSSQKEIVLKSIAEFIQKFKNNKGGVNLYYNGCGKKDTGDWCFQDGFITFRELADLYLHLLRGCVLTIITDCSYSGNWVKECMTFLDEQEVGPCGHMAKDKGILINVYASCLSHQIPRQLAFSVGPCCKNDKDTGCMIFYLQFAITRSYKTSYITDAQHGSGICSTEIKCEQNKQDDKCACSPEATWV